MSYTFVDEVPDERPALPVREKMANPFTDIVALIALKTDENGKPVAKGAVEEYDGTPENEKLVKGRIERLLREAGNANDPIVSVPSRLVADPETNTIKFKFWTTVKVKRNRKPADETTATTDK